MNLRLGFHMVLTQSRFILLHRTHLYLNHFRKYFMIEHVFKENTYAAGEINSIFSLNHVLFRPNDIYSCNIVQNKFYFQIKKIKPICLNHCFMPYIDIILSLSFVFALSTRVYKVQAIIITPTVHYYIYPVFAVSHCITVLW